MRVVILGSGVVGVASAWYLNQAGHEVTVIDREPGAALETSAANAGQISPGYAAPWAAPGVPLKAIKWMFQRHAPLAVRLTGVKRGRADFLTKEEFDSPTMRRRGFYPSCGIPQKQTNLPARYSPGIFRPVLENQSRMDYIAL